MSNNFETANRAERNAASKRKVKSGDLNQVTVSDSEYTVIFSQESSRTNRYAPGFSVQNVDVSRGFADLDLVADDTGATQINGDLRPVIYQSDEMRTVLFEGDDIGLDELRAAVSANYRQKVIMPQMSPYASQNRVFAYEVIADSASDGLTISQANSSAEQGLPYAVRKA